jgi:cytochrome c peroxidase
LRKSSAGCFGCHTTEAFVNSNPGPLNNGLDLSTTADQGALETFVGQPRFAGAFKTPSLRNIELSAPYMHDGRFKTLDQVIEHYNSGVQAHPNLAAPLKDVNGNPIRLNLTQAQKSALLAFLKTLTDRSVESNPMWSTPFK